MFSFIIYLPIIDIIKKKVSNKAWGLKSNAQMPNLHHAIATHLQRSNWYVCVFTNSSQLLTKSNFSSATYIRAGGSYLGKPSSHTLSSWESQFMRHNFPRAILTRTHPLSESSPHTYWNTLASGPRVLKESKNKNKKLSLPRGVILEFQGTSWNK